ncbi:MAG: hypothetical protein ABJ308_09370 [Halieaceae bacterium]
MAEFIIGNSLRKLARRQPLLQRLLWRLDYVLVWSLVKLFSLLPIDTASRLGQRVGSWVGPRMRRKHAIYRANMRTAFPDLSEAALDSLVREAWGRAGRVLAEYPHLETILQQHERLEIDIREPIITYTDQSRPCVIVTAHVSNWEVACSALARLGIPNASLYTPPTNPLLDQMLADNRTALNCELLARDKSARLLIRALKQGRTAGIVADRRIDEGKAVRFFGQDKLTTLLPAKLALKLGCDLVPLQVERTQDANYRVTFHPPIRPSNTAASESEQSLEMMQQLHHQFEDWIRQNPADWFCSKRLWPKATKQQPGKPPGDHIGIDSYAA